MVCGRSILKEEKYGKYNHSSNLGYFGRVSLILYMERKEEGQKMHRMSIFGNGILPLQ